MEETEELRRLSAGVFGNRYRAELIAALAAGSDGFCLGDLALTRHVSPSVYHPPVRTLVTLGLVERLDPAPG
ncbi:hypothetical protein [Streptomyces reniochalinae]|uniref:ArsR family transcriptional regulator n=1 Tax=Streptomyces reniochalinae TaxID=2250578 RepID=A0A367E5B9_9ACTN|nr:hypothetical protein [Streptomyces reniochalinae]RCG13254.1 hypothetical protein DQ392_33650 [Streptomyces reniochalinae]